MKTYAISMPITGLILKEIEAESEKEALDNFYNSELSVNDIQDWDIHEYIVKGNVFYGVQNELYIEEI